MDIEGKYSQKSSQNGKENQLYRHNEDDKKKKKPKLPSIQPTNQSPTDIIALNPEPIIS